MRADYTEMAKCSRLHPGDEGPGQAKLRLNGAVMSGYQLCLREVILVLSSALDFVGVDDIRHGKRVAFMAAECGRRAGWSAEEINRLLILGLLHDCGVSSSHVHQHLVEEWDWDHSHEHALRGPNC